MAVKQIVTLKGQKDGINIFLDEDAEFEDIIETLRKKVSQGKRFFDDEGVRVSFTGRRLDEYSQKILVDIIAEESDIPVYGPSRENREHMSGAAHSASAIDKNHAPVPDPRPLTPTPQASKFRESPTAFYYSGLRSGQRIKYEGSVVIMGDANPGSEIIADGNVVVLGALKGLAHAGATGDSTCFVSALLLAPTQLRIAGIISFVPPGAAKSAPAYAYVKEGQVFIGPL